MRILLFGKNGQVGWELQRSLEPLGQVLAVDRPDIDFSDLEGLRKFALDLKPDLIVNAAAYTEVDKAESEPEIAMRVNCEAPGVLAEAAKKLNAGLVHYSTDYVFDGMKGEPYTEEDEPNPINVYGETKLAGDQVILESGCAHLILRTSWVYGARGSNFLLAILKLAQERDEIRVVCDEIGSPTWCRGIADATAQVLCSLREGGGTGRHSPGSNAMKGLYNYCPRGEVNRFEFAKTLLELSGIDGQTIETQIVPTTSAEFQSGAQRPHYSVLDGSAIEQCYGVVIPTWQDQLEMCMKSIKLGGPRS